MPSLTLSMGMLMVITEGLYMIQGIETYAIEARGLNLTLTNLTDNNRLTMEDPARDIKLT